MTIADQFVDQGYDLEEIDSLCGLQVASNQWRDFLAEKVYGNNFFNDPTHISSRLEEEPDLDPRILVLRRHGRICCIAPCYLQDTHLKVEFSVVTLASLPIRMLKVFGGEFVVAADADATCCFQIVFEYLWSRRAKFGLIYLENLPTTTSLWEFCYSELVRDTCFRPFLASSQIDTDHQIQFPPTHEDFLSTLSYDTRRRLRRVTRRLQEKGQLRLERITAPDDVPRFLDRLDQIYRDTWQAKVGGYAPRNKPAQVRYLSQISRAGCLRSYLLSIDDQPIAFALGYQYNGAYYFLETGFDQAWADSSPGTALMHLFFEDLFRHDSPVLLDFIMGDQAYKRSFSSSKHCTASVYVAPRNSWRTVLRVQALLHGCSRLMIRILTVSNLDGFLRERLRQKVR
jgi:hypothetical protein